MLSAFPPSPCPCVPFPSLCCAFPFPAGSLLAWPSPHLGFSSYGKTFHSHSRISHSINCFPSHLPTSLIAPAHCCPSSCDGWYFLSSDYCHHFLLCEKSFLSPHPITKFYSVLLSNPFPHSSHLRCMLQYLLSMNMDSESVEAAQLILHKCFLCLLLLLASMSDLFWFSVLNYWLFDVSEVRSFLPSGREGPFNILWDNSVWKYPLIIGYSVVSQVCNCTLLTQKWLELIY